MDVNSALYLQKWKTKGNRIVECCICNDLIRQIKKLVISIFTKSYSKDEISHYTNRKIYRYVPEWI